MHSLSQEKRASGHLLSRGNMAKEFCSNPHERHMWWRGCNWSDVELNRISRQGVSGLKGRGAVWTEAARIKPKNDDYFSS